MLIFDNWTTLFEHDDQCMEIILNHHDTATQLQLYSIDIISLQKEPAVQRPGGWSLLAASTLILTVLLAGTVGALIYTQLYPAGACSIQQAPVNDPDITERVHFVNPEQV